jgi:hypothetical protein
MVHVIHNPNGTIKTFMQNIDDILLLPGESIQSFSLNMNEYASRFMLSYKDICCYTVTAHVGDPVVTINVCAAGYDSVAVDVNGSPVQIALESGRGVIEINTETVGEYLLAPADKSLFCAAGSGILSVEVVP